MLRAAVGKQDGSDPGDGLVFRMIVEDAAGKRHDVCFCDLPGYGFAKVSKGERARYQRLTIEAEVHRRHFAVDQLGHVRYRHHHILVDLAAGQAA